MKYILSLLIILVSLQTYGFAKAFDLVITPSHTEEEIQKDQKSSTKSKQLSIMINSHEIEKAGLGLSLGLDAIKQGIKVTYILGAKAVYFAKKGGLQNKFLANSMTPREILQEAIKQGATLMIYAASAKSLDLVQDSLIKGSKIVPYNTVYHLLYNTKEMRIITF